MIFICHGKITIFDRNDISRIEIIHWYLSEWQNEPKLVLVIAHCITMFYDRGPDILRNNIKKIYVEYGVERSL